MTNLAKKLIDKAESKFNLDIIELPNSSLKYKKTKFKTFTNSFTYPSRKQYICALFNFAKTGLLTQPLLEV